MLKSLNLRGIGPVPNLTASFGSRLNLFTGDNGLGKSFLLDVSFWALTGTWPGGRIAIPSHESKSPEIHLAVQSKFKPTTRVAKYDFQSQSWSRQRGRPPMPGLVIYASVDGSFVVWDPARNYWRVPTSPQGEWPRAFQFPPKSASDYDEHPQESRTVRRDVANGLEEGGRVLCNGLIADWNEWFYLQMSHPEINPFQSLIEAIDLLSHPLEPIKCIAPTKVFVDDSRKFPTLEMPYGPVAYPHWSAGVKRVISFAYLIVWAWVEHLQAAKLRQEEPTNQIVLIIDEIEAHLHPRWQRTILPAILSVAKHLSPGIEVQILATTHSPLVMASVESSFDSSQDELFCFQFDPKQPVGKMVGFENLPWAIHGDVVNWLTSDLFGLDQARSREAETAIEAAEAFLRNDTAKLPKSLESYSAIQHELERVLSNRDPFWPRWIVRAQQ